LLDSQKKTIGIFCCHSSSGCGSLLPRMELYFGAAVYCEKGRGGPFLFQANCSSVPNE
jgi:hypothetical protein